MKRNREARGGETDQQWLFHSGVYGFDLQTELQINATPRGKSKILMTLNLYTLLWRKLNKWRTKMNAVGLGGEGKSNSESVIRFQTNRETKCAGNASPRSAAPAAAVISFYFQHSRAQTAPHIQFTTIKMPFACDCESTLTPFTRTLIGKLPL